MEAIEQVDKDSPFYKAFIECCYNGAAYQDIYTESESGFARRCPSTDDATVFDKRRRYAYKEFMRIYNHLLNLAEPIDDNFGLAGKQVLDFGCGTGALAIALALKGADVTGADPNPLSLDACMHRARYFQIENSFTPKLVPSVPELPFADQSFDIVVTNSVLEFIPYRRKEYVLDMLRLVKAGGFLIISTENGLFPVDYYTGQKFTPMRRKAARAKNLPYGLTYFELLAWVKCSGRVVTDLSRKNIITSLDKLIKRRSANGRAVSLALLKVLNRAFKQFCNVLFIPADIFMPYSTYIFKVGNSGKASARD